MSRLATKLGWPLRVSPGCATTPPCASTMKSGEFRGRRRPSGGGAARRRSGRHSRIRDSARPARGGHAAACIGAASSPQSILTPRRRSWACRRGAIRGCQLQVLRFPGGPPPPRLPWKLAPGPAPPARRQDPVPRVRAAGLPLGPAHARDTGAWRGSKESRVQVHWAVSRAPRRVDFTSCSRARTGHWRCSAGVA